MITLGESFRRYGPAYGAKVGNRLPAHQRAAMAAIEQCRTEALGVILIDMWRAFFIDLWRRPLRQGTVATFLACDCHVEALIGRQ